MLIVGCGAVGRAVGIHYLAREERVVGLVRNPSSAKRLSELGIEPLCADLDQSPLPAPPSLGKRVFYFAPPPSSGQTDPRMRRFLASLPGTGDPRRIVYISTTGVYGDCRGAWVDETRPVAARADRARRRLDAENALREWGRDSGGELVILRVAGIYGPGRLPLARLRQGLPLIRQSEAPYSNRIHAHDLVRVCIAAMDRASAGEVFNVSDGHPTTMTDYFNRVADLAGLPRPPTIPLEGAEAELSPGMISYVRESRRLDNRKLREGLGIELRYATLEKGLAACRDESS